METEKDAKIREIIKQRKRAYTYYNKKSEVYRTFVEMEQQTYRDGALPKTTKELIAIGISIVMNCESCLEWHIHEALKGGATEEQIIEAIEVGMEMAIGYTTVSGRFAMNVLDYYRQES